MNRTRISCTIVFCLLFTAVTFVQRGSAQEDPAKTHENSPEAQQPENRPENAPEAKPEKQENPKPEKDKQDKNQDKNKDEKGAKPSSKDEGRSARDQGAQAGQMHPAGKSGHIPDDKFRSSFGKSHTFVMSKPIVVNNQPTFQHGGYAFVLVDPWPTGWAYTDDCYIDYIDGDYFLFDMLHPGVRIALFVEM